MALSLIQIEKEAEEIRQKIELGELIEGCCMSGDFNLVYEYLLQLSIEK
jgi:hypothetical protein